MLEKTLIELRERMNKRFLILLIFVLSLIIGFVNINKASAQFAGGVLVYPSVLELEFPDNSKTFTTKVIQVENPTDKPFRVRAYIEGWNLSPTGSVVFLSKPDKNSLNDYVKFNPQEFDLAPGQKQMVRLASKLPEGADGEYRSIIFFETVNPKQEILSQNKDKLNINVTFKTRYGVAVYAYKGKVARAVELQDLKFEKINKENVLNATLKNNGNIHCNLEGELALIPQASSNAVKVNIAKYTTLPGNTQKYKIQIPENLPANGLYNAVLKLNYKDQEGKVQVLQAQTDFSYKSKALYSKADLKQKNQEEVNVIKTPDNIAKPMTVESKTFPVDLNTEIKLKN